MLKQEEAYGERKRTSFARRSHLFPFFRLREREAGEDEEDEETGARSVQKGNVRRSYSFPIVSERRRETEKRAKKRSKEYVESKRMRTTKGTRRSRRKDDDEHEETE